MNRFRIILEGRIFGTIKIKWSWSRVFTSSEIPSDRLYIVEIVCSWLDNLRVSTGILRGTIYCRIESA